MRLTTPGAILLGFVAIAIAIFLGLRTRASAVNGGDVAAIPSSAAAPLPPLPLADSPRGPAPPPATGALADATRALAAQHDALVKACWASSKEGHAAFAVRAQFDDQGHLAGRLQISPRGQAHLDVSECIANHLAPIEIAPANAPANVEVSLTLP
jgi:hypothetical protein